MKLKTETLMMQIKAIADAYDMTFTGRMLTSDEEQEAEALFVVLKEKVDALSEIL